MKKEGIETKLKINYESRDSNKQKIVKNISILGIVTNSALLIMKFFVGIITHSQAMIADAFHSVEDMLSSVVSYIAIHISSKNTDRCHPYGYGKAEYICSLCISIFMIIASASMIKSSILGVISGQRLNFNYWIIIICVITMIVKGMLYLYTKSKYIQTKNILIKASMADHRNDIFITLSVLIGGVLSYFGLGMIDSVIGVAISSWIGIVGIRIFKDSCVILIDTNLSEKKIDTIKNSIYEFDEIENIDRIIGKPIGEYYIILLKLKMDSNMNIYQSHTIQTRIKRKLIDQFDEIQDVIIHVNPY